jgi:hypothetical protein
MGRGTYGKTAIGADGTTGRPSIGKWIVGGLLVGSAVLWAKHQSDQIAKLYSAAGIPHQNFIEDLRVRSSTLSGAAHAGFNRFKQRLGTRKAT